jgi:hypothetical protein
MDDKEQARALLRGLVRAAAAATPPAEVASEGRTTAVGQRVMAALYDLAADINSADFRAQHGAAWPHLVVALVAHLERRQARVADEDMERVTTTWKMVTRAAPRPPCGLRSNLKIGGFEELMAFTLTAVPPDKRGEVRARMAAKMLPPAPSTLRPPLSCRVARFDPSFDPLPRRAPPRRRCARRAEEVPSDGMVHAAGGRLVFVGGQGWKQHDPCLRTWGLPLGEKSGSCRPVASGFFEAGGLVFVDGGGTL